jgi:methylated-DNA-[protein]-cysteine S-methyltransferase
MADREGNLRAVDWTDHGIRMQRILRLHYGAGGVALQPTRNPNGLTTTIARYFGVI